jgi:hypothetical protein
MRWQVTEYTQKIDDRPGSEQRQSIKHDRNKEEKERHKPHAAARHLDRIL